MIALNYLEKREKLKEELVYVEEQINLVLTKINNEILEDSYFNLDDKNKFRFATMLTFGTYYKDYEDNITHNLSIKPSLEFKTNKYKNYFDVYQHTQLTEYRTTKKVGFVCEKTNLFNAIENDIHRFWLYYVNNKGYKASLNEFTQLCKSKDFDLYESFGKYINEESFLIIVDYPQLGIKDVIIYIE